MNVTCCIECGAKFNKKNDEKKNPSEFSCDPSRIDGIRKMRARTHNKYEQKTSLNYHRHFLIYLFVVVILFTSQNIVHQNHTTVRFSDCFLLLMK